MKYSFFDMQSYLIYSPYNFKLFCQMIREILVNIQNIYHDEPIYKGFFSNTITGYYKHKYNLISNINEVAWNYYDLSDDIIYLKIFNTQFKKYYNIAKREGVLDDIKLHLGALPGMTFNVTLINGECDHSKKCVNTVRVYDTHGFKILLSKFLRSTFEESLSNEYELTFDACDGRFNGYAVNSRTGPSKGYGIFMKAFADYLEVNEDRFGDRNRIRHPPQYINESGNSANTDY